MAILGDAVKEMKKISSRSINLIVTSPPYALQKQKEYGNISEEKYLSDFFHQFIPEFKRVLTEDGSLVINIGGSWIKGQPVRSLYHYKLLIDLVDNWGFHLAQDFFWYNPAKIPNPAQWVNIERCRVKDAVEPVWWLSKNPKPKANNRRVLTEYTKSMENLLKNGYNAGSRPSGWKVNSQSWKKNNGGAIPPNFLNEAHLENLQRGNGHGLGEAELIQAFLSNALAFSNTDSNSRYLRACRKRGIAPHPARFPRGLPEFFVKFLTEPGDLVLDPFAGSNLTGQVAEENERRWVAIDLNPAYLQASSFRFSRFLKGAPDLPQPPVRSFCGV